MGEQFLLLGAVLATFVVLVVCVPILSIQLEIWRVKRRYELSKEEVEIYVRELGEVRRAVAMSLGKGASSEEVKRLARESIIAAILRERARRGRAPLADLAESGLATADAGLEGGERPQLGRVTREELTGRSARR